jgi:hypothetical protein
LEQVREELEVWRANPGKGRRIPDSVWRKAVCAAKQQGVNPVSRALGLDYNHLKRRMACGGMRARGKTGGVPAFLEIKAEAASSDLACVIELEKGGGTRMRICVKSASSVDWSRIKEAFLGA